MMYDILGGERDLPYRMTSGKALKIELFPKLTSNDNQE